MHCRVWLVAIFCLGSLGQQRLISHVSRVTGGFIPTLLIANTDGLSGHDVELRFYDQNGGFILANTIHVQAGETNFASPEHLSSSDSVSHIAITGDPEVKVTIIYQSTVSNSSPVHVSESAIQSTRWRIYQGNWSAAWDGVAMVNPNGQQASVDVKQYVSGAEKASHSFALSSWHKQLFVFETLFSDIEGSYFEVHSDRPLALTSLRGSLDQRFLWENVPLDLQSVAVTPEPYNLLWQTEVSDSVRAGGQITDSWWYIVTQGPAKAHRININNGAIETLPLNGDIADVREQNGDVFFLTDMDQQPTDGYANFSALSLAKWNADTPTEIDQITNTLPFRLSQIGAISGNSLFAQNRFCDDPIGRIISIDTMSGNVNWNLPTAPCTLNFYVGSFISTSSVQGNQMQLINQNSGQVIKTWDSPGSFVAIDESRLYGTLDRENRVVAINFNGQVIWEYDTPFNETYPLLTESGLFTYIWGKPSGMRDLVMLDPDTGLEKWKQTDFLPASAAYSERLGSLYLVATNGIFYVLNSDSGALIRELDLEDWGITGIIRPIQIYENKLFVESLDNGSTFSCVTLP